MGHGASVDKGKPNGTIPLLVACQENNICLVVAVLGAGGSVDLPRDGEYTPLYIASQENHVDVVIVLLGVGASVDLATDNGATPLHAASQENTIKVIEQLLADGVSMDLTVQGYTPLKLAKHFNHTAAVELLEFRPQLTQLMVAAVMRQEGILRKLLRSGEDPTLTV